MAYNIKAALRAAKNMQYEPIEVKVREATNNDPWGVSTSAMSEISRATHHHDEYALLFKMVWKRLNDHEHVMHVQKALILIDYLLRNGAERFISDAKRRARDISALQKYKQYDANNRDVGGDVRAKAKAVYELLTNESRLTEERSKAQSIRDVKLSGMGNDGLSSARMGAGHAREFDEDRYNQSSPHGGNEHDWEKEENDSSPMPNKHRHARGGDDEAKDKTDEPTSEKKKKKKKSKAAATEEADEPEAEPAPEDGEKKKKKKKKKSSESADTTAPPSAEASAPSTPSFTAAAPAAAASFDTFDSFGGGDAFATSSVTNSGAVTPAAAAVAAPAAADKPKKSRKKKDAAAAELMATAAPTTTNTSMPTMSVGGDYDLTNFAAIPTPRGPQGDLDILTGTNAPAAPLEDMFAQSSLMDGPMDANGEEDGFLSDEPALLDQPVIETSAASPRGPKSPQVQKKSDIWDLAGEFTNIDNIHSNAPVKKKQAQQDVVSMSMMRSMQPFGSGSAPAPRPAAGASPFFGAPGAAAANPFGGMGGMPGGFGAPGVNPMAGAGGFPPSYGGMGGMPGGMPGAYGVPAGFGGMPGAMGGGAPAPGPFDTDLPFAAPAGTKARAPANGKPIVFDAVPAARAQQLQQQSAASSKPTGPTWTR